MNFDIDEEQRNFAEHAREFFAEQAGPEAARTQVAAAWVGHETDEEQQVGAYVKKDSPKWAKAGGWRTAFYSKSLGLAMLVVTSEMTIPAVTLPGM